jgi:hydrogenase/urease accessory protein HupE
VLSASLACAPHAARGHGLDPAALTLQETEPGVYAVEWRASALRIPGTNVQPVLPHRCQRRGSATAAEDGDRIALRWTIDCGAAGLTGETIAITDLAAAKINGLLTIDRRSGLPIQAVLSPRNPTFTVPSDPSHWDVVHTYGTLGVEHIVRGPDHLLFVFGLLLLASTTRLLVRTITAFTVGHSITLSAAALGLATVPQRPIEVLIALSILLLANELARVASADTWLRRAPWAVALVFGLLHGFGFAGALAEAGLPPGDVPLALLSFNGGIEVGQLLFVTAILALGGVFRFWQPALARHARRPAVYAMGMLAAFWCCERIALWQAATH